MLSRSLAHFDLGWPSTRRPRVVSLGSRFLSSSPDCLLTLSLETMSTWTPDSWRAKPVGQTVEYPSPAPSSSSSSSSAERDPEPVLFKRKQGLESVAGKLQTLPPLVSAVEVRPLSLPPWQEA